MGRRAWPATQRPQHTPGINHRLEQLACCEEQQEGGTAADDFLVAFAREIQDIHGDSPVRKGSAL